MTKFQIAVLTSLLVAAAYYSYACWLLLKGIVKQNEAILSALRDLNPPQDDGSYIP
jgi:hypothetical protein